MVGRTLGWQHIKSTAFDLTRDGDRYHFSGHGSGHGVGMCVIGSVQLAAGGQSAVDILNRYYPGLEIGTPNGVVAVAGTRAGRSASSTPVPRAPTRPTLAAAAAAAGPEMLISLPDGDEGERAVIADLASRARAQLSRTLAIPAPRVVLRFHPTIDAYEEATGQPWFTSGAMVNGEVHLPPLTVLRDRGVLERTVRHELVHAMTNTALAGRPLWIREGAAIYFAGEPPIPVTARHAPLRCRRHVRASPSCCGRCPLARLPTPTPEPSPVSRARSRRANPGATSAEPGASRRPAARYPAGTLCDRCHHLVAPRSARQWKGDDGCRTVEIAGRRPDSSTVALDDPAGDGKRQSEAAAFFIEWNRFGVV